MCLGTIRVPRGTRGRLVVRTLKDAGHAVIYKDVAGQYLADLPAYQQGLKLETLTEIGVVLMPEYTDYALNRAAFYTNDITENPIEYGLAEPPIWREEYERQALELLL